MSGQGEQWKFLESAGDSEDFALEKRRRLVERGWPANALLVTVAKVPKVGGHVVLVVVTDRGDYVLDILERSVRPWTQFGCLWVKRQSQLYPRVWMRVDA